MEHDDLDRVLSGEEDIVPSSGFVASVMDVVRREAQAPPQIPFPWKRALAGLAAGTLALVSFVIVARMQSGSSVPATLLDGAKAAGAGWIALALLLSLVSVRLSMRLTGSKT